MKNLLHIKNYDLSIREGDGYRTLLDNLNINVKKGQIVGLAGPSGSGKSLTISAILQLLHYRNRGFRQSGDILYNGDSLIDNPDINRIRNQDIGLVFQQSSQIFNPSQRVGAQIKEKLQLYSRVDSPKTTVINSLGTVRLKDPQKIYDAYPHELSGGQIQRCLIAMAIINRPHLLIADEPFSSLDTVVKTELVDLFRQISRTQNSSILLVSHDQEVLKELCDRIYNINNGKIIENPDTPIRTLPSLGLNSSLIPLLAVINVSKAYKSGFLNSRNVRVLKEINLTINKAEIVGLYGDSGAGKSTLARILARLDQPSSGRITYMGKDIDKFTKKELQEYRSKCQIIFQDSFSSMSPHRTVKQQLSDVFYVLNKAYDASEVNRFFAVLNLDNELLKRYRHELSGGQRQRIMIARALVLGVEFLICDEILASLDAEVGYILLEELRQLNQSLGLTILFISHDLEALNKFCTRVIDLDKMNQI